MTTSPTPDPERDRDLEREDERVLEGDLKCESRLDHALAALPREVEPPASAWPAVRARLAARATTAPAAPAPWRRPPVLAAFALVAMLLVMMSVALLRDPRGTTSAFPDAPPSAVAHTSVSQAAADAALLAELSAALEARRAVLSPETIAIVERNMRAINAAIAETARALADDPGNVQLERMLAQVTRQRDDFVRDTRALIGDI